jgi:hypothetical protein
MSREGRRSIQITLTPHTVKLRRKTENLVDAVGLNSRVDEFLHELALQILKTSGVCEPPPETESEWVGQTSRKNFLAPTARAFSLAAS